jgi:hypothetical protein
MTSNSADSIKQVNFGKDTNDSGYGSKRNPNVNMNSTDMFTNYNEKMDFNHNHNNETNQIRTTNNNANLVPISETRYNIDEDEEKHSRRKSITKTFGSPKRNTNSHHQMGEREKRTILEHYRKLYSFKKENTIKSNSSQIEKKTISNFPLIRGGNNQYNKKTDTNVIKIESNNFNNKKDSNNKFRTTSIQFDSKNRYIEEDNNINNVQKNSLFRSSIYSSLMPTNANFYKNKKLDTYQNVKLVEAEGDLNNTKSKGKVKNLKTPYGPFLHINNNYEKDIEIKSPELRRSLEDINYYGPYFSHCPICRYKNLDFYQTMEPHQCLKLLNYIKLKRSGIKIK